VDDTGGADLPGGGGEGVDLEMEAAGEHRADSERDRGENEDDEAGEAAAFGRRSGAVQRGPEQREHADGSEQRAEPAAQVERLAAGQSGFDERDENWDHGDDQRGVAGGDFGLSPDEQDVVGGHEEDADQRELPGGVARHAQADA